LFKGTLTITDVFSGLQSAGIFEEAAL